jgi:hypothetical protein
VTVNVANIPYTENADGKAWYEFAGTVEYHDVSSGDECLTHLTLPSSPFWQRGYRFIINVPGEVDVFVYHPKPDCWHCWRFCWERKEQEE